MGWIVSINAPEEKMQPRIARSSRENRFALPNQLELYLLGTAPLQLIEKSSTKKGLS